MGAVLKFIGIAVIVSVVYLAIAIGLIFSQRPGALPEAEAGLDFARLLERRARATSSADGAGGETAGDEGARAGDGSGAAPDAAETGIGQARETARADAESGGGGARTVERTTYAGADGQEMPMLVAGAVAGGDRPVLVMIHGSGWDGTQFAALAARLSDVAEVRVPTLRGHGPNPARRGDVDYIGQFEDDLAALLRDVAGRRQVVMLGHSSGGGLVVRFAGGSYGKLLDGAVLLAPFLKYDAPTTRENSGGWAHPLTRRIIGLSMLNRVGIHALDDRTVIRFAMPREVLEGPEGGRATTAYSWRLNVSYAPRADYLEDVAALPPFLLVAGRADEAFVAEAYEPLMSQATDRGRYALVEGAGHLDVVDAPETEARIRDFLGAL